MPVPEPTVPDVPEPTGQSNDPEKKQASENKAEEKPAGGDAPAPPSISPGTDISAVALSYRELSNIADAIARNLAPAKDCARIVVSTDWNLFQGVSNYRATMLRVEELINHCDRIMVEATTPQEGISAEAKEKIFDEPVQEAIKNVTGILTAVSGLLALFKTEISITQVAVDLDAEAVAASVIGAITRQHQNLKVFYQPWLVNSDSRFAAKLAELGEQRRLIATRLAQFDDDADDAAKKTYSETLEIVDAVLEQMTSQGGGELTKLLQNEALREFLSEPGSCVLALKPIFGGGDRIETARAFWHRTDIRVSGGAGVAYMFANAEGHVLTSGNVQRHSGYVPYGELRVER